MYTRGKSEQWMTYKHFVHRHVLKTVFNKVNSCYFKKLFKCTLLQNGCFHNRSSFCILCQNYTSIVLFYRTILHLVFHSHVAILRCCFSEMRCPDCARVWKVNFGETLARKQYGCLRCRLLGSFLKLKDILSVLPHWDGTVC